MSGDDVDYSSWIVCTTWKISEASALILGRAPESKIGKDAAFRRIYKMLRRSEIAEGAAYSSSEPWIAVEKLLPWVDQFEIKIPNRLRDGLEKRWLSKGNDQKSAEVMALEAEVDLLKQKLRKAEEDVSPKRATLVYRVIKALIRKPFKGKATAPELHDHLVGQGIDISEQTVRRILAEVETTPDSNEEL